MKKLIFVYNGDSGLINGMMHYLHKRISPGTYPCQLCGIIFDGISMNTEWLSFVKSLGVESEFLHRDEYQEKYGKSQVTWPAVLLHDGPKFAEIVIAAGDFAVIPDLKTLQERVRSIVSRHFPTAPGARLSAQAGGAA